MTNSTIELTYGQATMMAAALKQMEPKGMKKRDAEDLAALQYKTQIVYKGQRYRIILEEVYE